MLTGSIVRRHNHANVIRFLGIPFEGTSFPAILNCPFCGKSTLYAFDYAAREDVWFNCTACAARGNIITLAAQIWNIDAHSAISRLLESGLTHGGHDEDIVDLIKLSNKQKNAELFWETASAQTWTHADDATLHRYREFGISKEIPCEGMVGTATGEQLADLYASFNRAWPRGLRNTQPATVLPYYDLPGHFSGFLVLQTSRQMETTQVFLPVQYMPTIRPDAGYFMLNNALLPAHPVLKDTLFLVNDPAWVLQAQTTQLRHDATLLPICGTYSGKEAVSHGTSLHNFKHSKKLFSGAELTPEIVSQAANAPGYACVPPPEGLMLSASPLKTMRRLNAIYRSAKTWQTVLEAELKKLEPAAAVNFANRLNINRNKLQAFLRTRTELTETAIFEILSKVVPHYSVELGSSGFADIIERDDGWYTPSGMEITTCSPRITRIIYTQNGEKYYEGYVKKQDVVVEFFATAQVIEKIGLLTYSEQLLAAKNILVISATRWNRRAVNVALRLHPPEVLKISDKIGWDDQAREFRFSTYSISNDGEIIPPKCPQLQSGKQFDFPEPTTAAPFEINDFLTPSHENAFVWTIVSCVFANFLAPVMGVPQNAVAVPQDVYDTVTDIGRALCCEICPASKHRVVTKKTTDNSLMLMAKTGKQTELKYIIVKWLQRPLFLNLPPAGILAALSYGWMGVEAPENPLPKIDYGVLKFVAPTYVQRVLRSRIGLAGSGSRLVRSILRDMHKWFDATYGRTFNLAAAERYIIEPDSAHIVLMNELNNAISSGHLDVMPRHRLARQKQNYILRANDYWWINKRAVEEYLVKNCIAPDWKALLNCFSSEGVFCGEETVNGTRWFLFDKVWCDKFWADYEEKSAG